MSNENVPNSEPRLIPAVADAAKDLTGAVAEEAREIASLAGDQARTFKEKLVDSSHEIRDWASEGSEAVKRAARSEGRALRADVDRRLEQTREKVGQLEGSAADYIRSKPLESFMIALGIGFLLGRTTRR